MTRHREAITYVHSKSCGRLTVASQIAKSVETINWIPIEDELPDEGVIVLLYHPGASEPVWAGVFEGCTADGYAFSHDNGSMITAPVLAWAEFPGGPD